MNNLKIKKLLFALMRMTGVVSVCVVGLFALSCTKEWDDHYNPNPNMVSDKTLTELISANPELSTFAEMLKQTKYDEILSRSQAYTVFAPKNEALQDLNMNDPKEVLNAVENHITRFIHSASGVLDDRLYMVNAKFHSFVSIGGSYELNGSVLQDKNILAKNGIMHTLSQRVPFVSNLWQYMNNVEGYDSIRTYLYAYTKNQFQVYNSTPIDINEQGLTVYDSVFTINNEFWSNSYYGRGIGYINEEDSIYTMLMPTNAAWNEMYELAKPYFLSHNSDPQLADSTQRENTKYAIVENLVFRNKIDNPAIYDSLTTTRRNVYYDPPAIFVGGRMKPASNGLIYEMDKLNYAPWDAWHKKIRIEAEYGSGRETDTKIASLSPRYLEEKKYPQVSNSAYLEVNAMNAGARPWVEFEIPNTLAGAYDIYCIFVPSIYYNPNQKVPDKTRVRVTFYELRGADWVSIGSDGELGGIITPSYNENEVVGNRTREDDISKMLLYKNFKFKYANYNEKATTIKVRISCSITTSEYSNGWTNNMKIDCILLEPVIPSTEDEFTTED